MRSETRRGGFSRLCNLLLPGNVVLIEGRPGIGKTSLACDLVYTYGQAGMPVYISMEHSTDTITERLAKRGRTPCLVFDSVNAIETVAIALRALDDPVSIIILDYLQLAQLVKSASIVELIEELKNMALSFQAPIVVLSQLSRGVNARENKRLHLDDSPILTVLTMIDTVISLSESNCNGTETVRKVDAIIAKSPYGTYTIPFVWNSEAQSFLL